MHIIHVSSEMAPVAKVGGLGDVLQGLSRETLRMGHSCQVILPKYQNLHLASLEDFCKIPTHFELSFDGSPCRIEVWRGIMQGVEVFFIDPQEPCFFFEREEAYGYGDDINRFTFFSLAALEFLSVLGFPDIIHCHDWQTALLPPLFYERYSQLCSKNVRLLFSIHNLEYQGHCLEADLERIGVNGSFFHCPEKLQDDFQPHLLNLMRGAIVYSNWITTVSPRYAIEALGDLGGKGLHQILHRYQGKFSGVLNGIDWDYWNPKSDPLIAKHFYASEAPHTGKQANKRALQEELGLELSDGPLLGSISRLVPQKCPHLIRHGMERAIEWGGQFVLLGSSPIEEIQAEFEDLQKEYAEHPQVSLILQNSERVAHQIFAASDLFMVPSLFEPCGLTQLLAMRYGAIPVVRETGGLADTVFDLDYSEKKEGERNGFVFKHADETGLDSALSRAFELYRSHPQKWRKLISRVMKEEHSWKKPTEEYFQLYEKLLPARN